MSGPGGFDSCNDPDAANALANAQFERWLWRVKRMEPRDVGSDLQWLWEEYAAWCADREGLGE